MWTSVRPLAIGYTLNWYCIWFLVTKLWTNHQNKHMSHRLPPKLCYTLLMSSCRCLRDVNFLGMLLLILYKAAESKFSLWREAGGWTYCRAENVCSVMGVWGIESIKWRTGIYRWWLYSWKFSAVLIKHGLLSLYYSENAIFPVIALIIKFDQSVMNASHAVCCGRMCIYLLIVYV